MTDYSLSNACLMSCSYISGPVGIYVGTLLRNRFMCDSNVLVQDDEVAYAEGPQKASIILIIRVIAMMMGLATLMSAFFIVRAEVSELT